MTPKMNRRDFVKATALGATMATTVGIQKPTVANQQIPSGNLPSKSVGFSEVISFKTPINNPRLITADPNGNIFVAGDDKIICYSRSGHANDEIPLADSPTAMVFSKPERLFADHLLLAFQHHIEVMDSEGKTSTRFHFFPEKSWLVGITVNSQNIFVSDCITKIVYGLDWEGNIVQAIGKGFSRSKSGSPFPGFAVPSPYFALDCDRSDRLWVANPQHHQLVAFTPEGLWESDKTWGKASLNKQDGFTGCCNPAAFALLDDGRFVTVEKTVQRVKVFSPTGTFQTFVAQPKIFDPALRLFETPPSSQKEQKEQKNSSQDPQNQENKTATWKPSLQVAALPALPDCQDCQVAVLDPANRKVFVFREINQ